ncbi:4-alpha-glucanotransferase [bacterium]|nr:4-alpha-glucanotransferase [bacterium]
METILKNESNMLSKEEKNTVRSALKALNKNNFVLIMHSGSFPAAPYENTGFGTINSSEGKEVIDYCSGLFDAIQLGPAGKTKSCDSSPYTGTIFSANPLFIDLKQLTTPKWEKLLSVETYEQIISENPCKDVNKTAYSYIYRQQNFALDEVWANYKKKHSTLMEQEFHKFKKENEDWLDNDALYEALIIENNCDYWPNWLNETDKNLLNPQSYEEKMNFGNRIEEIEKKYSDEIDKYKFTQFICAKQNEETLSYAIKHDIKLIADRQVAFSDRDSWAYQSLFLKGWCLGCPPDYFSEEGQAWGFPVMDPEKLFKSDGTLDEGGLLLKKLYRKMFRENPGGVRIDHLVGLIDPWVYKKGHKPRVEEGAGRLYSSPNHPELCKYAIPSLKDLNQDVSPANEFRVKTLNEKQISLYGSIVEKIIIKAAEEEGQNKDSIICENLGTLTYPVLKVIEKYKLSGMAITQFTDPNNEKDPYKCHNMTPETWAMTGSHDNKPIKMWADEMINTHIGYLHAKNLVKDVYPEIKNVDDTIVRLTKDAEFLSFTKLTELFVSNAENIQIFFTDYFNVYDVYNKPGTSGEQNWSLRLPDNYRTLTVINLPKILVTAMQAKGKSFVDKNSKLIKELEEICSKNTLLQQ